MNLRAPFPWFGGKSRVASLVWERFGDVPNYVEPFAGSLAVLLGRPHAPRIETVNDVDCVGPDTRILRADLTWARAANVAIGDRLLGFDEKNGPAHGPGLRAPTRYRRLAHATVTGVRVVRKPSYRLTFDDGTSVIASEDHLWLGGSHGSGGRGWRWVKTSSMVCNRKTQRTWVLKVANVADREETWEAGWLAGLMDGEAHLVAGPGLKVSIAQNEGPVLDRAERLLAARGFDCTRTNNRRCRSLLIRGGMAASLDLLMRVRPERLIEKLASRLGEVSLYGRDHRAVGLISKEFLGDHPVVAIETDCHTFIAEGLASHNCYLANFWRAVAADPEAVAVHCDWPVNEADLSARHQWLVDRVAFRERMAVDPEFFDARIAGWWVWGACAWIGSGWCDLTQATRGRASTESSDAGNAGRGVHRQLPHASNAGQGVHRQLPHAGDEQNGLYDWMRALANRLRRVRVACGDWSRVCTPSVTHRHGVTAVLLDPPYGEGLLDYSGGGNADATLAADVRAWAIENGDNPLMRIALCGYEGQHAMPDTWDCVPWKAHGGYGGGRGTEADANSYRERVWFSPHCLGARQPSLFSIAGVA